jgi:hypothetical protein
LRVFSKTFGRKRGKATGDWRRWRGEELHELYPSQNIIRVNKPRGKRWAGRVALMGDKRNVYRVFMRKPDGKKPLGRPRRRWKIIFKRIFKI